MIFRAEARLDMPRIIAMGKNLYKKKAEDARLSKSFSSSEIPAAKP